jgi:hypothetical protein
MTAHSTQAVRVFLGFAAHVYETLEDNANATKFSLAGITRDGAERCAADKMAKL